jgi:hypothetical protein
MVAAKRQPWEQLDGEGDKAFEAFTVYRDSGIPRSLPEVSRRSAKSVPLIKRWSAKYRWAERARAWDAHRAAARDRTTVRVAESDAEKLARERHERDVQNLVVASQLKLRALQMLDWAMEEQVEETRTVSADGHTTVIQRVIQPARWRLRDAAVMAKVAKELEDLTLGPPPVEVPALVRTPQVVDEAGRRVAEWRERLRGQAAGVPERPPGGPGTKAG